MGTRRSFIKQSCSICLLLGSGMLLSELTSCVSMPVYKTVAVESKIVVPLSVFADKNLQMIRAKELDYDIALRKEADGNCTALLMQCTHADNGLMVTGSNFTCNLHGSQFDSKGVVTKGPAERPLKKFVTEVKSDNIIIHLT